MTTTRDVARRRGGRRGPTPRPHAGRRSGCERGHRCGHHGRAASPHRRSRLDEDVPNRVVDGSRFDGGAPGLHHRSGRRQLANNGARPTNRCLPHTRRRAARRKPDYHDVFVVQLDGSKRWRIWEPLERSRSDRRQPPLADVRRCPPSWRSTSRCTLATCCTCRASLHCADDRGAVGAPDDGGWRSPGSRVRRAMTTWSPPGISAADPAGTLDSDPDRPTLVQVDPGVEATSVPDTVLGVDVRRPTCAGGSLTRSGAGRRLALRPLRPTAVDADAVLVFTLARVSLSCDEHRYPGSVTLVAAAGRGGLVPRRCCRSGGVQADLTSPTGNADPDVSPGTADASAASPE